MSRIYISSAFSRQLLHLMDSRSLTVQDVVQKTGIAVRAIKSYLIGTASPRLPIVDQIAHVFGVSSFWLLGLADEGAVFAEIIPVTPPEPSDPSITDDSRHFGARLKKYRRSRHLQPAELAKMVNIPADLLAEYEDGVRNPDVIAVKKMASALDIPPAILAGWVSDRIKSTD